MDTTGLTKVTLCTCLHRTETESISSQARTFSFGSRIFKDLTNKREATMV